MDATPSQYLAVVWAGLSVKPQCVMKSRPNFIGNVVRELATDILDFSVMNLQGTFLVSWTMNLYLLAA